MKFENGEQVRRPPAIEIPVDSGIRLRQFTEADVEELFWLIDESRIHLSQFDDPTAGKYPDLARVQESIINPKNPDRLRFGIWDEDVLVGSINITPRRRGRAEIGYWLGAGYVGLGYMTKATEAIVEYGATQLGYKEIIAKTHPRNTDSMAVLRRAGFAPTGETKGQIVFSHVEEHRPGELVLDVERIPEACLPIHSPVELEELVEVPLRSACQKFMDKGIPTFWSSANRRDIGATNLDWMKEAAIGCYRDEDTDDSFFGEVGQAVLMLNFDDLSAENQRIALETMPVYRMGPNMYFVENLVLFRCSVRPDTTIEEVERQAEAFVDRFEDQS
jgi:RimJ/RimL family protein N-acetyltransferase